ncbi:hypothetical protein F7725_027957 [Dissostichus mawsoni]|uniref:Polycystin cation channel PKD1/PKD2 domain-containing protein n=1 Tax=Dissostichus mawsoni TaxID=36200 RepID=A0A7J5XFE8_DISMA|nr:hypothetical protein F7725_027957 [Dissostichus mawsoni]
MEDRSDLYDVYTTNAPPPWEDPQHQCLEDQDNVECLRRKIKYYFMNPCEKYHARGRKPWKLILQIIKIAIITIQLVSFGLSNQMVVTFKEENLMTFKHLFLKDYADGGMDSYAVYRQADVYDHIYYIIKQDFYRNGTIFPGNDTFEIDAHVETAARNIYLTVLFDCLIIITCIASLALCTRSVINGIQLQFAYTLYSQNRCGQKVPWSDRLEFVNGWYILIIASDTLTIVGSILKIEIQSKVLTNYDLCSIFLGIGTMFVWTGLIRYMGYFRKYNILILTLRAAFPNVIRFICCAGIIYLSYCFCGWVVLGPYHEKFRTLNTVSECLFSLINGDDMYPTFKNMKQKSSLVWVFSRVYLYSFVSLFIYMILSLFITIITDTYDTIKQQQLSGIPTSELQRFMSVCKDLPNSGMYRLEENSCFLNCCVTRCRKHQETHQERLTSEA